MGRYDCCLRHQQLWFVVLVIGDCCGHVVPPSRIQTVVFAPGGRWEIKAGHSDNTEVEAIPASGCALGELARSD
jgi:hypothetical protein